MNVLEIYRISLEVLKVASEKSNDIDSLIENYKKLIAVIKEHRVV